MIDKLKTEHSYDINLLNIFHIISVIPYHILNSLQHSHYTLILIQTVSPLSHLRSDVNCRQLSYHYEHVHNASLNYLNTRFNLTPVMVLLFHVFG